MSAVWQCLSADCLNAFRHGARVLIAIEDEGTEAFVIPRRAMLLTELRPGDLGGRERNTRRERPTPHFSTVAPQQPRVTGAGPLPVFSGLVVQPQVAEVEVRRDDACVTSGRFVTAPRLVRGHQGPRATARRSWAPGLVRHPRRSPPQSPTHCSRGQSCHGNVVPTDHVHNEHESAHGEGRRRRVSTLRNK